MKNHMLLRKSFHSLSESDVSLLENAVFASRINGRVVMAGILIALVGMFLAFGIFISGRATGLGISAVFIVPLVMSILTVFLIVAYDKLQRNRSSIEQALKKALSQRLPKTVVKGILDSVSIMPTGTLRYVIDGIPLNVTVILGTTNRLSYSRHPIKNIQRHIGSEIQLHYIEMNSEVKLLLQVLDEPCTQIHRELRRVQKNEWKRHLKPDIELMMNMCVIVAVLMLFLGFYIGGIVAAIALALLSLVVLGLVNAIFILPKWFRLRRTTHMMQISGVVTEIVTARILVGRRPMNVEWYRVGGQLHYLDTDDGNLKIGEKVVLEITCDLHGRRAGIPFILKEDAADEM